MLSARMDVDAAINDVDEIWSYFLNTSTSFIAACSYISSNFLSNKQLILPPNKQGLFI